MNWFYNHKGKLKGPLSTAQVLELITRQELGPDDLIFAEGQKKWSPLSEVTQFQSLLDKHAAENKEILPISWVVLQRHPDTRKIRQLGPFDTTQLQKAMHAGQVKLSDYVWRAGMKEWYRILSIPELAALVDKASSQTEESTQTAAERAELLKNVVELQVRPAPPEEIPEEAREIEPRRTQNVKPTPPDFQGNSSKLQTLAVLRSQNWKVLALRSLILVGFLFLAYALYTKWKNREHLQAQKVTEPVVAVAASKGSSTPKQPQPNLQKRPLEKKKAEPTPTRAPTYAKLSYSANQGVLKVQTDASANFRSQFQFTSLIGQIVGAKSYYRSLRLSARELNLKSLRWPEGNYSVQLQVGDKVDQATVFIGSDPKGYQTRLANHNKQLSMEFMSEKRQFVEDTQDLTEFAETLLATYGKTGKARGSALARWDKKFRKWGSSVVKKIGPKSRNSYILAPLWLELKGHWKEVRNFRAKIGAAKATAPTELEELTRLLKAQANTGQSVSLWR